jgi:hypothetical protein
MKTTTCRTVLAAAGVLTLAVSLTACGAGEPGGTGDDAQAGDDDTSEADDTEDMGPLDVYFDKIYGEYDQDQANAQQIEAEEITAACMQEQGFTYTPVDYSSMNGGAIAVEPTEPDIEWGTVEFAEKYGYGATTNPWGDEAEPMPEETGEEWVDPNQEYVESMSETERTAYYLALYGDQSAMEEPAPDEEYVYDWTTAGCSGKAQHEVYEEGNGQDTDEFKALQEDMDAMWEASAADPRLADLNSTWASCMADAGYPGLAAIGDAENAIYEEVNALWEDAYEGTGKGDEEMTEEDYNAINESIEDAKKEITPREIKTATADFGCREEIRYDEIQREVNVEYQQEFVDSHKAELDAWAESGASGGAG